VSRLFCITACSLTLMGCVFRDFEYQDPPNLPPSVHGTTETPMDTVWIVDLDAPVAGDGGPGTSVQFFANVRDPNVSDQLVGVVFVDRSELSQRADLPEFPIPAEQDGTPGERRVPFMLPRNSGDLAIPGCHSVELHVSRAFTSLATNPQADPEDLGIGVWWVASVNDSQLSVDMTLCQKHRNL
jgi:hypothetical protein